MAITDSKAAFEAHCTRVDPSNTIRTLLARSNIETFSSLAFAIGTPQAPPSDDQFRAFGATINGGAELNIGLNSALRRIHFEASTMVVAELKSMAVESSVDSVRKLPVAEKQARLQEQEGRLRGIRIRGELQPSYALVDLVAHIKETNCIIWIAPSKCSKRDTEIQNSLKEKSSVVSLEQQTLKVTAGETHSVADTSTDLQLQWALQRRGLAMDQCRLIGWDSHEQWVQQIMSQLTKEVPSNYCKISTSQVIKADKELFTLMAQEIQTSVQPLPDGSFPMERKLNELRTDPRVTMHMLPLPRSAAKETIKETERSSSPTKKSEEVKKKKKVKASAKARSLCPDELKKYPQRDPQNNAICWAFNLKGGCKLQTSNGRCKKGMHICMKCHRANHSLVACRSNN